MLHCGSFCHENKFLVCVNISCNKAHCDSDIIKIQCLIYLEKYVFIEVKKNATKNLICLENNLNLKKAISDIV